MKAIERRKKGKEELATLLGEKQLRQEEIVLALHQKKQKNLKELHLVKKDIARIKTIIREIV